MRPPDLEPLRRLLRRPLAAADAAMNRLYGWRGNPLYHSGTLVVVAFLLMLLTGIYLLLFYRIGGPYESIVRIQEQAFAGRWIRALHRYAADLAVAAAVVHAFRMFVQGRSWGARSLAWVSGAFLLFLILVCGWTGYVMVWDDHAQLLAFEGARLLDALPIFSEPIIRTFVGEHPVPSAFFFLNLFLHIALPIGAALLLWLHVARLARPTLLPPRALLWWSVGLLLAASVWLPAPLGPEARLQALLPRVEIDLFYSFWLPFSRALEPLPAWLLFTGFAAALCFVPLWTRPPRAVWPLPSRSDPHLCTGCDQCALDCPYDAIEMIPLDVEPVRRVARVDAGSCVSCGICTASCAPMAVGPTAHTGRDELARLRRLVEGWSVAPDDVVVVACENGAGRLAARDEVEGARIIPVRCVGHLHTSLVELLLRSGAGGVLLASCPPRDCWSREGPKWLDERLHHAREAELRESIDRRRIRVVHAGEGEARLVLRELAAFRGEVELLDAARPEHAIDLLLECEPPAAEAP